MSREGAVEAGAVKPAGGMAPGSSPMQTFVLLMLPMAVLLLLFDPVARDLTGRAVGSVLNPTIGFGGGLPVLTIMVASVVMTVTTAVVRDYFTDYLKQAKAQETVRTFQKELRDARKDNNLHKMKRLTEANKDLMQIQAEQSSAQLKPMAITMVVVIPIFAWLLVFADPGSERPEAVAVASAAGVAWATSAEDLRALGLEEVAEALVNPGRAVRVHHGEQTAFQQQLAARKATVVSLPTPGGDAQTYAVAFNNPRCEMTVRVPWDARWCVDVNIQAPIPILDLFPRWVALYSLFGLVLNAAISRALKAHDLRGELARTAGSGSG